MKLVKIGGKAYRVKENAVDFDNRRFVPLRFHEVLYEASDESLIEPHKSQVERTLKKKGLAWHLEVVKLTGDMPYKLLLYVYPKGEREP
jgi:hypothetical protein